LESTTLGVQDLLGGDVGEIKSVSTGGGKTWGLRWSASTSSTSVSRVTMIGLLKGREVRLPKVKSFVSGYKGNGETSTVRSVMVVVQNKEKIFAGILCDGRRHFWTHPSLKIDEKTYGGHKLPTIIMKISQVLDISTLSDMFPNSNIDAAGGGNRYE